MTTAEKIRAAMAGVASTAGSVATGQKILKAKKLEQLPAEKKSLWPFARAVKGIHIPTDQVTRALVFQLTNSGAKLATDHLIYQGSVMDVFAIIDDQICEYEVLENGTDFVKSSRKVYRRGKVVLNKRAMVSGGTGVPAKFYFVVPAGMFDLEILPAFAGVIYSFLEPGTGEVRFCTVREPDRRLHERPITENVYSTIAQKIHARYLSALNQQGYDL